ncbi:MAG: aminopeptidase P N-terminal domain-containing protein [Zoogloeaceae bacterium]|jgi:Xaa-Pro aminopeptidase|nr:aminopeptidase P N-terminal domain-containing protein [Zoogloeaceae bacterium]
MSAAAAPPLSRADYFDPAPFARRRAELFSRMGGSGVALIPNARERLRNASNPYPFRSDSFFYYLTGFSETQSALVLANGRALLFCRARDEREIWEGYRFHTENARARFAVEEARPIAELESALTELLAGQTDFWYAQGMEEYWDQLALRALKTARAAEQEKRGAPTALRDWREPLSAMRLRKDAHEVSLMRQAADIASAGHARALRACRPGMTEYALEAEISHEFRRRGADGHAYNPIVAGGVHACTLHYTHNDAPLRAGSLVLIDAGCEYRGYAADITRTFPVGGRFSAAQKICYEIVLAAQEAALAEIRPGSSLDLCHAAAVRVLTQGMKDLGLLSGDVDGLIERGAYQPYYMHRTGHWLGLDVHDAGAARRVNADGQEVWTAFAPGMTLTCEPGLYIPANHTTRELAGMGIRVEDDALVTPGGCEVYTAAPKSVADIEETMRQAAELDLS